MEKPLRMCVADIFKGMGSGISVSGTIQAGSVHPGDKIIVMPQGEIATVKSMCSALLLLFVVFFFFFLGFGSSSRYIVA